MFSIPKYNKIDRLIIVYSEFRDINETETPAKVMEIAVLKSLRC